MNIGSSFWIIWAYGNDSPASGGARHVEYAARQGAETHTDEGGRGDFTPWDHYPIFQRDLWEPVS